MTSKHLIKRNLRAKQTVLSFGLLTLMLLGGCSGSALDEHSGSGGDSKSTEATSTPTIKTKEITFYPDTYYHPGGISYGYVFSGFPDNERLMFQGERSGGYFELYFPAEVGFKFKLSHFKNSEFEIMEINRKENYVKLKTTTIQ